jgi:pyruvate/2-oxoglutarate/acetoin dehydrogenase E1 component
MSCDGFYGNVPGLVLTIPSTAYDAYGLLRTAADYRGPVLQMEPKRLYRMKLGPALPGEPTDPKLLRDIRRSGAQLPIDDFRIPFGKAALRHSGDDITVISWGWACWMSVAAAQRLSTTRGIGAEVLDLRTLVPYDRDKILESARRTGRVLIVQNDRTFAGFGRQIQGDILETLPGVTVRLVGQMNTPAVGQSRALEDAITVQEQDIYEALDSLADDAPQAWLDNELHWLNSAPSRQLD